MVQLLRTVNLLDLLQLPYFILDIKGAVWQPNNPNVNHKTVIHVLYLKKIFDGDFFYGQRNAFRLAPLIGIIINKRYRECFPPRRTYASAVCWFLFTNTRLCERLQILRLFTPCDHCSCVETERLFGHFWPKLKAANVPLTLCFAQI